MSGRTAERCAAPPHESHAVAAPVADNTEDAKTTTGELLKYAALGTYGWFRDRPADRLPLLGPPLILGGGLLLNHFGASWWAVGLPTIAASVGTYAVGMNRTTGWTTIGLTTATVSTGAWLATFAEVGFGRPTLYTLCASYALGYGIFRWARRRARGKGEPEVVAEDTPRWNWEAYFEDWGLTGAAVLKAEPTRLGERCVVSTKGTKKRASQFTGKALEERIAEDFDIPAIRVKVSTSGLPAGQLSISVRTIDPWSTPVLHPLFDPNSEIKLDEVADVRKPLVIGMDPETGKPLTTVIWDEDGGKHTLIVATNGGGKSVALNDLLERLTAASNAVVWGINLSKAQEMRRWAPSLDLAAVGRDQRPRARAMLRMAKKLIEWRGAQPRDTGNLIPTTRQPLLVIVIDEMDALTKVDGQQDPGIIADLGYITSKGRSEAVVIVLTGQRATQSHIGSTDVRSQMTNFIVMKTASSSELNYVLGDAAAYAPNMAEYGENNPGVALTYLPNDDRFRTGRTFALAAGKDVASGLGQIDRIVSNRPPNSLEGGAIVHLGKPYADAKDGRTPVMQPEPQVAETVPADQADTAATLQPVAVTSTDERKALIDEIRQSHLFLVPDLTEEGKAKARALYANQREQGGAAAEAPVSPLLPEVREKLISMLDASDGVATRDVEQALGVSNVTAYRYMAQLKAEGVAVSRGNGPASRWHSATEHVA